MRGPRGSSSDYIPVRTKLNTQNTLQYNQDFLKYIIQNEQHIIGNLKRHMKQGKKAPIIKRKSSQYK